MRGKLIVIEGTDCSGKETQTTLLVEKLNNINIPSLRISFPNYNSPTGKIIGGPYLGKKSICEGFFNEGAANVDPMVASLYFSADRKYNILAVEEKINLGNIVILDRYVDSNTAHQGGKYENVDDRKEFYNFIDTLEYKLLKLPRPDLKIFLHVPYEYILELKKGRKEEFDQHEASKSHLINSEKVYLEICEMYNYKLIECVKDKKLRSIEDINLEIFNYVKNQI